MSEMVERAAKAMQEVRGKHERERYERAGSYGQIARDWAPEYAVAALLAALDPEDQRIVDVMTGVKDGGRPDHDYDDDVRAMLRALRDYISQGASVE